MQPMVLAGVTLESIAGSITCSCRSLIACSHCLSVANQRMQGCRNRLQLPVLSQLCHERGQPRDVGFLGVAASTASWLS
jgi:hypothetical protein